MEGPRTQRLLGRPEGIAPARGTHHRKLLQAHPSSA